METPKPTSPENSHHELDDLRVLAVDDDPGSLETAEAFCTLSGFRCFATDNPEIALRLVREMLPDVVLLDIMMPRITGYEICRTLKGSPDTRLIPVVLVTSLDSREDRLVGIEAGCDDFVTKPFDRLELAARIRSLGRLRRVTENLDAAEQVLSSLARSVEAKDGTTGDHCDRLAWAGRDFGRFLGLEHPDLQVLERAGILHDIGKVGIPDAILLKKGKLTPEEWDVMRSHTVIGADLLAPLTTMRRVVPIVRSHHERWDGTGYPDRLSAGGIPYLARVFQMLDACDALVNERPYKAALTVPEALQLMAEEAAHGKWDPSLFPVFRSWAEQRASGLRSGHGIASA